MSAAVLDVPRIATFADVNVDSINQLLSVPNAELLTHFLQKISEKAAAYEGIQSDNVKLKVELENAVRSGNAKYKAIKTSLDKSLEETSKLRQQLQTEGMHFPLFG